MFALSSEQWNSPEMATFWRLFFASAAFSIIGVWIASRMIAGEDGGLWRTVLWHLAHIPLLMVVALLGTLFILVTPVGGTIATLLLFIILPIWAAGRIFKVGFWRGFAIALISWIFFVALSYGTQSFIATPEEIAALEKSTKEFTDRMIARGKIVRGKGQSIEYEPSATVLKGTEKEWQKAAVEKYPDLGLAGSRLNTMFVARVKTCKTTRPVVFQRPDWPLKLADEVAGDLDIRGK